MNRRDEEEEDDEEHSRCHRRVIAVELEHIAIVAHVRSREVPHALENSESDESEWKTKSGRVEDEK
jgi:hypothetical protein